MQTRAEQLYGKLQTQADVLSLVNQSEDAHLDCKQWPKSEDDAKKMLAKAVCGLANADGGVLVIGMDARKGPNDEPDVITAAVPVADTRSVASKTLDLIGQLVEPGVVGIQVREIPDGGTPTSGYVIVFIPAAEGPPHRSKKPRDFFLRIGSGTFPMEYFQISDRFGRRPHPRLELYLEELDTVSAAGFDALTPFRWFVLGLKNTGRGISRFPGIRLRRSSGLMIDQYGIDGSMGMGLTQRATDDEWFAFRGGADEVIYPDETRKITKLRQAGQNVGQREIPPSELDKALVQNLYLWRFPARTFECEISGEGLETTAFIQDISERSELFRSRW